MAETLRKPTEFKGPDLTREATSLRKSVWRELSGLKKSVLSKMVTTKGERLEAGRIVPKRAPSRPAGLTKKHK